MRIFTFLNELTSALGCKQGVSHDYATSCLVLFLFSFQPSTCRKFHTIKHSHDTLLVCSTLQAVAATRRRLHICKYLGHSTGVGGWGWLSER